MYDCSMSNISTAQQSHLPKQVRVNSSAIIHSKNQKYHKKLQSNLLKDKNDIPDGSWKWISLSNSSVCAQWTLL
jgi:hypothetical protein